MIKHVCIVFLCALLVFACKESKKNSGKVIVQQRDTTITVQNAYSNLFFDSTVMESFISKQSLNDTLADRLRNFYNGRNYQYAWFDSKGITEYVNTFVGLQNQYMDYAKDSSIYNARLQKNLDVIADQPANTPVTGDMLVQTELLLTEQFFKYAAKAYGPGDDINAKDLAWFIPRKKVNTVAFLDSLLKNKGKNLSEYEPVNRQYNLLKGYLLKYYAFEKEGDWQPFVADKKAYRLGDSSKTIAAIKKRLVLLGDLAEDNDSTLFNPSLEIAVKSYQRRYGLKEDGVIGAGMLKELNKPIHERINQILVNMERLRWVPAEPTSDYLLVNIPEYRLHVYEGGKYAWNMNVVVGSVAHSTVIFSGTLSNVVFSPYWNVPPGILKNEVLPGIKRNSNYLARHNMEWNGGNVRQKPGPSNSLGLVKFLFPNSYNIYLHDTPAKSLFNESSRAFSHGCIRLSNAKKLAQFLLRKDSSWTDEKITKAMNASKEQYVKVKEKVPVFIVYFTAWVDREGKLNFRDDVYGHDRKLGEKMFVNK